MNSREEKASEGRADRPSSSNDRIPALTLLLAVDVEPRIARCLIRFQRATVVMYVLALLKFINPT
jgi:hypothetical protein